jgi:hypothetical protein
MSKLPDGLEPIDPLTWRTIVARCLLGSTVKLVAYTLANYASSNGADVHPGEALVMKDTELGETTVRSAMATLREVGLIYRTFEASTTGLRDKADDYQLTFPDDLEARIAMWDPKRKKITRGGVEQAPPAPKKRPKKGNPPAGDAGGSPVDNSPPPAGDAGGDRDENRAETDASDGLPAGNHRQEITEPPAGDAETTGNTCPPPSHVPSHRPSHNSGFSPYGAELEGKPAARCEPSAKDPPPAYRQSPLMTVVPSADTEYDTARASLAALGPDAMDTWLAAAHAALGDATTRQIILHAADLARRPA